MKKWVPFIFSLMITISLVISFNQRWDVGSKKPVFIPPLGKFFSPFEGLWQNVGQHNKEISQSTTMKGLTAPVQISFDEHGVPHVFAQNNHDLYFTQGYLTAKDRLWQMEFQVFVVTGRLSEIFGHYTFKKDLLQRRLGLMNSANESLSKVKETEATRVTLEAYAAGVNAYISSLSPKDYPIEYKLLDYSPEAWADVKSLLTLRFMAQYLSGRANDLGRTRVAKKYGMETLEELFPRFPEVMDPVIPKGTSWDFNVENIPSPPQDNFIPEHVTIDPLGEPDSGDGSNNWAAAGSKTKTGKPLLSNDPHLRMNLPSIWYEMQLSTPEINVYGVSIPGAPCVTIGFNENIAWGVTNSTADVMDWYEVRFKDENEKEYWYDNKWHPTKSIEERIKIRGQEDHLDQVLYTHHGPVVIRANEDFYKYTPKSAALKWTALESGDELLTFWKLNRAKNYDEYVTALETFYCPGQNFAFASKDGDIAIWHNGRFPLKWVGQGHTVLDGSNPKHEWQGWIPHRHNPHVKNPPSGYISSANQIPTDPSYPYFIGRSRSSLEQQRNVRINERLAEMKQITPKDFQDLLVDNKNLEARTLLPILIKAIESVVPEADKQEFEVVKKWQYDNNAEEIAPSIFEEWTDCIKEHLWKDDLEIREKGNIYPATNVTAKILREGTSKWIDNQNTEEKETATDIILTSWTAAIMNLRDELGPMSDKWQWYNYKGTFIPHMINLPGLGTGVLKVGGGDHIVNAIKQRTGPSWRMIVSLEDEVKAWGNYPGGQSGHPGHPHYQDFIDRWSKGEMRDIIFLRDAEAGKKLNAVWQWKGGK